MSHDRNLTNVSIAFLFILTVVSDVSSSLVEYLVTFGVEIALKEL